ncbi:MAG: SRPBCC domain-containing protein [Chloroflexi bacterium]|nr:SRPBCC domain-containing protein [Chloroflexota bacterium]
MKTFHAQTIIKASADKTWGHLTDFARYSEWNPFLRSAQGDLQEGAVISIQVANQPRPIKGKIKQLIPNARLQLESIGPLGLLKALFTCEIVPLEDNRQVKFTVNETFTGPLAKLFGSKLEQQSPLYSEMCQSLKTRVEQS